jgi:hypothetical protein
MTIGSCSPHTFVDVGEASGVDDVLETVSGSVVERAVSIVSVSGVHVGGIPKGVETGF